MKNRFKYLAAIALTTFSVFAATEWGNLFVKGNLSITGTSTLTGVATLTAAPVLSALTASTVPYLDASKVLTSSAVTPTELGYLSGVTSAIQTQINALSGTPAGTVIMYGGSACPTGYVAMDGSAISRTTYSDLYNVVLTTYGTGNGTTTFNVPDARGVFIRGSGSQTISSITYTGTRGTTQGDQLQGHYHNSVVNFVNYGGADGANYGASNSGTVKYSTSQQVLAAITDGTNGTPRLGSETRPANIVLLYCIKI